MISKQPEILNLEQADQVGYLGAWHWGASPSKNAFKGIMPLREFLRSPEHICGILSVLWLKGTKA
jgi:hypothetical protein